MRRTKKEKPAIEERFALISKMLVPEYILKDFEIYGATEHKERWIIEMREKEGRIPAELAEYQDVVFDGYSNPIEMLSHSFVCKPIYLRCFRRRYKRSKQDRHYSNAYDLTLKGVKMVPELGFFLKEED